MLSKILRSLFLPRKGPTSSQKRFAAILSLSLGSVLYFILFTQLFSDQHEQFIEAHSEFQDDLDALTYPSIDLKIFRHHRPHHYNTDVATSGTKLETFATFFCTPNSSIHDPYFAATLNLVYRNLWSPTIATKRSRPFTVFVAPFVTQEQRDVLAGAGAVIIEIPLVHWEPNVVGVLSRWRYQFSKLHFWNQSQFDKIVYMDSDAFPIKNIDSVFDETHDQQCNELKLEEAELTAKDGLCHYIFAAVYHEDGGVNGGFLVIRPEQAMYQRLMRNYQRVEEYDNILAEQSFLIWQFASDGAFPVHELPRKYNAFTPLEADDGLVSVVHEKLWALSDSEAPWLHDIWGRGWKEMVEYFDSPKFLTDREKDGMGS
jgi:inositol 3-alpha-galactosyltransferase